MCCVYFPFIYRGKLNETHIGEIKKKKGKQKILNEGKLKQQQQQQKYGWVIGYTK